MKFAVKTNLKAVAPVVQKAKATFEDAYDMEELNLRAAKAQDKAIEALSSKCEIFASLTIAELKKSSKSLESLGEAPLKELADAFGCSVEALNNMTMEDFSKKASALMPKDMTGATAGTEVFEVVAGAVIAFCIIFIIGCCVAANKFSKYDMPYLDQSVVDTLRENAKEALDQITANTFTAKQYAQQIKAINGVLDFLDTDIKKFYDPSFKIAEIEKKARELWASPNSQAFAGDDDSAWWKQWRDNMPKREFGTLGELGFTVDSLVKTAKDLEDLAGELNKLWQTWVVIKNGRAEARKGEPGFFGKIKRFFTESEEDRDKRKHAELLLNAKYQALRNLLWGVDYCGRTMFNDFIFIAVKTQNYVVKAEKKDAKAKAAK